jgi:phosphodiesterase/alkaline phosphatase D-like protein
MDNKNNDPTLEGADYPQSGSRRTWLTGLAGAAATVAHVASGSALARAGMAFPPAVFDACDGRALIGVHAVRETRVHVRWSAQGATNASLEKRSAVVELNRASNFSAAIPLAELPSRREIVYAVFVGDERVSDLQRFRTPPAVSERGDFAIAFSGDMEERYRPFRIFEHIAAQNVDAFLHLGDTVYADVPKRDFAATIPHYRRKHAAIRADASLQQFMSQHATIATWDDHEIENGAHGGHPAMREAAQVFDEYWPNRGTSATGLYRKLAFGRDLELFALDTRRFRLPQSMDDGANKTMLGSAQKSRFAKDYAASEAKFRVIASSVPMHGSSKDAWGNYATERDELFAMFREAYALIGAKTIVLSADYHFAREWPRNERRGIYEFMAGPLAAFLTFEKDNGAKSRHTRGDHFVFGERANFGVLRYEAKSRTLRFEYFDDAGTRLQTRSL